jgi:RHH-type transcriptional regulator, proline utilization regulon repressor / proline dehydrogenase / delta 1-pyrroline-5-carboxylate dehydrogenase
MTISTADESSTDTAFIAEIDKLVRHWLDVAAVRREDRAARRLAALLKDPDGLAFTVAFVDRVVRPEDDRVAAASLRDLAKRPPRFLAWYLRLGLRVAGALASVAPVAVMFVVRAALRSMVGHLLIDATDARLGRAVGRTRSPKTRLNFNLLGEAVLGEREAERRLDGARRLLMRPDVDYVSIKVSATVPPVAAWAFDEAVGRITERLLPLYTLVASASTSKFINLDMEEYRDLDLTLAVFMALLDRPELLGLEAGIVLQAYLPDALSAMRGLQEWARGRRARGGACIKVRLVKGANLPMERVEASLHGWPLATWATKQETDTNYKRVLRWAMTPERLANVRLGVAGHNLFDVAYTWVLAGRREVRDRIDFEMLLGMAAGQAAAVRETVGGLLLYTPVVHPDELDVAIAYLVRRLEEGASSDNFMSAVFELHDDVSLFERERSRFLASLAALDGEGPEFVPAANRVQDRRGEQPTMADGFDNTPDTDPSVPGNRAWAREIIARVATSSLGAELVDAHTVTDAAVLERILGAVADNGWGARSGAERAAVLRRVAVELEGRRSELLEVMAAECGKTLDQGDPEVSEAIDFANYYATLAEELDQIDGARHVPVKLTVVAPPWNFPVAIAAGSTLAALAAGSGVVIKPATQARRSGSLMVQALWDAGVPIDALALLHVDEGDLGRSLIADPRIDRLVLTGAFETAALFRSFRPDLALIGETSGKNAIVVTPSADFDLAVKDIVASAFGHAGQKCSAASLCILVGSVARSRRFLRQLVDATTSLQVGWPSDPTTQMGPLIEPAAGKLRRALTELAPGETWLVQPRRLDETGRLWAPGLKSGVARGSEYHLTEYFGPVLGLMAAEDLTEAIEMQNQVDYGLTAGLHSLDPDEISLWLDRAQAGNLYVNRGTTGAIVRRQPFGGWKRSAVGAGTKAGGPNFLVGLSDWTSTPATVSAPVTGAVRQLVDLVSPFFAQEQRDFLDRAVGSDAAAWQSEFGTVRDVSGLQAERNVLRYVAVPVWIRSESGTPAELVRVVAAGLRAGSELRISVAEALPAVVTEALEHIGCSPLVEDRSAWRTALAGYAAGRVRLLGGQRIAFAADSGGRPEIAVYAQPVVEAGRVELLTFLQEQAVAVTAHRFGSPTSPAETASLGAGPGYRDVPAL